MNPLPVVTVSGNTLICLGNAANLTATGANNYTWIGNQMYIGSPVALSPAVTTSYLVEGTDSKGCKGNAQVVVVVDPCTGINAIAGLSDKVSVYPNPNNGVFTVQLNNSLSKTIEVMDVTGRVVVANTTSETATDVNISSLSNGVYYVRVKN